MESKYYRFVGILSIIFSFIFSISLLIASLDGFNILDSNYSDYFRLVFDYLSNISSLFFGIIAFLVLFFSGVNYLKRSDSETTLLKWSSFLFLIGTTIFLVAFSLIAIPDMINPDYRDFGVFIGINLFAILPLFVFYTISLILVIIDYFKNKN
jgi:hypothetical protein